MAESVPFREGLLVKLLINFIWFNVYPISVRQIRTVFERDEEEFDSFKQLCSRHWDDAEIEENTYIYLERF